jgi:enoyl-CoA hydratase
VIAAVYGHCYTGALEVALADADEAVSIGLAEYTVPYERFDAEIEALAERITANSPFTHAAVKRLLEATDGRPLDAGLQWEVAESEGFGPDMHERIAAFTGRSQRGANR